MAEEKIKNLEHELQLKNAALDSISEALLITDPKQKDNPIIYANKAFLKMTGYSLEEVLFLQGEQTDMKEVEKMKGRIQKEQDVQIKLVNYKKDGTPFLNELKISPIFGHNKELVNFLAVETEISAL